jgi:hyperosmotically inducible protein
MRRLAIWSALLATLFLIAVPSLPAPATSSSQSQKTEEKYPSALSREIHHQILMLPFYSVFDFVTFTLQSNKVTLSGQVLRHNLKDQAEAAVKSLEGVDSVVNNIVVLPVFPPDDDFRRAIYRAVYEDPTLARYGIPAIPGIHIIVKNGNVTLEGSVDSLSDKNLAALRAGTVANVLGVKNNLVVLPKGIAAE